MNIETFLDALIAREGGFVDHPSDPGGATNFGITERVARAFGYRGSMQAMTETVAREIYRNEYWHAPGFADVSRQSRPIAEKLLDMGVNCGVKRASEWFQRSLNALNSGGRHYADIKVDGDIGDMTCGMLALYLKKRGAAGPRVMIRALEGYQAHHYLTLAEKNVKFEDFLFGWLDHRIGNIDG